MKNFNQTLVSAVSALKGTQFISMEYVGNVKLTKAQTAQIGGVVTKECDGNFSINYSYANAVSNRASKEQGEQVEFVGQSLPWGAWVPGQENKFIEHRGELYLRFYGVKDAKVVVRYFVNGVAATEEQAALIKSWTERAVVKSQESAGLTENQVIARSVKIDNIMRLSMNGKVYVRTSDEFATA